MNSPLMIIGDTLVTFDFNDRKVIVTGGSRGIGRAIALAFADCGARVSVCARGADARGKLAYR
jgi:NAD(P)-dependent dehydrogenase (short-subunit alcohol dehydrogenase family)